MSSLLDLANSEFEYEGQASYDRKQNLLQQLRLLTSTRKGAFRLTVIWAWISVLLTGPLEWFAASTLHRSQKQYQNTFRR